MIEVFEALAEESSTDFPADDITSDMQFADIGVDSLSMVTALMAVEAQYDIDVKPNEMSKIVDIKSMIEVIQSKL